MAADAGIWDRVEALLGSGVRLALATTGGGSELVTWLLNHPGASRAVVEVQVPYHERAVRDYLGAPGPHRAEEGTARDLATKAFARLRALDEDAGDREAGLALGLGCTAALATNRARRGEERAFLALRLKEEFRLWSIHFVKGAAGRPEQEDILSRAALAALEEACGMSGAPGDWPDGVRVERRVICARDPVDLLLRGEAEVVEVGAEGRATLEAERFDRVLFPGSFNPFHRGHEELSAAVRRLVGRPPCLEISVENVDKPALTRAELEHRLKQVRGRYSVVLTRAPTFLGKSRLFGNCRFVIGYDTAERLMDPGYYEGGVRGLEAALAEMAANGCAFLVAGRLHFGRYMTLEDLELPGSLGGMFEMVPESSFRADISSSELRASGRS